MRVDILQARSESNRSTRDSYIFSYKTRTSRNINCFDQNVSPVFDNSAEIKRDKRFEGFY